MKYVVFLVDYAGTRWEDATDAQQAEMMGRMDRFTSAVATREGCAIVGGEALTGGDSATVLRPVDGEITLTDGPFSEATEGIGGFYVVEAPDLDVLVELLSIMTDYVMEVRPVDPAFE